MTLLLTMFPFYLLGNLHCMGMCGPLAMTLGAHRYRNFYFIGRLLSFTAAGGIAGGMGAVVNIYLNQFHISSASCLLFGSLMLLAGLFNLFGISFPGHFLLAKILAKVNGRLSLLILQDLPLSTFLFGFLTIALPCGQSLIVFSACALSGSLSIGALNGFAFAFLTSPALFLAMKAHFVLRKAKKYYNLASSLFIILAGLFSICRGLAEYEIIPHIYLSKTFHIVLF